MFNRKNKARASVRIELLDEGGAVLGAWPAAQFPLPEDVVLALSVEYFNDPEPCHIHRSAVHKRAMMELMECCPVGTQVAVSSLAAAQRRYFPEGACEVRVTEQ